MKKFIVIPVMFLYLLAMSGVMIHMHYCGKTLESWSVYSKSNGCEEGECGDEEKVPDPCCKDKVITSKVSHDQHFIEAFKLKNTPAFVAIIPQHFFNENEVVFYDELTINTNRPNAPPGLWQDLSLYKLYQRFTYYG